ncbi:DNA-directed RNA polymerase III, subunit Rpc31 [Cantharellus anzutake]|uniref:DNA-directed RNA polymerase III, subunit Rpc31 n=1 Tax=Cantharellus anzutake TaxID=1750568 RepID=UPI001903001B|nr:DNA-directed RNA polymerase III, subunit Rpc31 [Cantharellus anzutake]KAF8342868.1 DNA-directed RNA polymerase III, subunit Rpc31 [Cantharellus anzutake]
MSRGRGAGRGRGRGGGIDQPIGGTWQELNALDIVPTTLFPPLDPFPMLTDVTENDLRSARYQQEVIQRLRHSRYYIVEDVKKDDLPRYSDRYRATAETQPKLQPSDLDKSFFPSELWDICFNAKKRLKKGRSKKTTGLNLGDIPEDDHEAGSEEDKEGEENEEDEELGAYEDEEDDDYVDNYFDNGEGEDMDDLGGGDDGGGLDYD